MAVVVSLEEKRKGRPPGLDALLQLCGGDLERVNRAIVERMHSPVELIPQLAGHLVEAGGKRLRPLLTLAAARLCNYRGDKHILLSACVEFIHTATLLHDDVVDGSDLRRGKPSANAVWGNKAPVLVGDFMFTRAFELMVEVGSLEVLRILSEASSVIAEGEVLQLQTANNMATSETAYLEVIEAKTAKLFAAACQIGGVIAERPASECEALESYGSNIGIAFQLVDDVLDYTARQATLGKAVGDDFREGKITLPVILAFRRGDPEEREFWRRTMERLDQKDGDLERALELMQKHAALADTLDRARHYGKMARDALALFPDSPVQRAFLDVVDFSIERAF
ncbi:MAG: polyprenyl synthetase family protein [Reyranellaceae bacterium]